jgi:T5orf172 domain
MVLSAMELEFLTSQGLSPEDVFDCRGKPVSDFGELARKSGKTLMLSTQCSKGGHRLRTRKGHCAQCDPKKLSFQKRHRAKAKVYVAHSSSKNLSKIGSTIDIDNREKKLCFDRVASAVDWKIVFYAETEEAGKLEQIVHSQLGNWLFPIEYFKDGKKQISRECFTCTPIFAVNETIETAQRLGKRFSDTWHDANFRW